MQRIYAIVIFIITATLAQAQLNEVPLTSNPVLEKHYTQKQQQIQRMLQVREANLNLFVASTRDVLVASGTCVEAEELYLICTDTVGLGAATTVTLLDGGSLSFGTASLDTNCVTYIANSNVDFGIDSIKIEVCAGNDGMCDTIIYPIYAHRLNNTITLPTNTIQAEDTITVCVPIDLPSNFSSAEVLGNNTILGEAFPFGNCIFYEANRFAGTDVVTFEICDDFCVCDIYEIPFVIQQDTLSLPFMDDFSYDGPFPNNKWLTKDVFVNNTMAVEPVSVGVATFDGLNEAGAPYGGGYGSSDNLTSAYLDLSPYSAASDVFLSFYVQPKGLGEAPTGNDSLILEFKDSNEDWILIDTFKFRSLEESTIFSTPDTIISGLDTTITLRPNFAFFSYPIDKSQYLYNGFQFRFRNFSIRSGNIDHWNIDYVRLKNNISASPFLDDIAFTKIPNPILGTYTSMPWWHFVADIDAEIPTEDSFVETHVYNHGEVTNTAEDAVFSIDELQTTTNLIMDLGLFNGTEANIPAGIHPIDFPTVASSAYPNFKSSISNDFASNLKFLEFEKTYSFTVGEENPNVDPIVEDNNVVTHTTIFDNYFAYDDGTAESGLEATTEDVQIAVKFHANVADTLKAIQFHFPHIKTNTSNQIFNLKVWVGQLDEEAEYVGLLQKPLYIDSYQDSLNGFTTYILKNIISGERTPLAIPAGDFYVGWQQVSVCNVNQCIAIGMDRNNPNGIQNVFFDGFGFGTEWKNVSETNPDIMGSLMIRPIVGEGEPQQSSKTEEITNNARLSIFPNPTNGLVNIEIENGSYDDFSFTMFDAVGKMLNSQPLSNQMDISDLQNGIYFLKIVNDKTREVFNQKIILVK